MRLLTLCLEFFKTGLFSIGGGLATIPFLKSMGEKYNWFSVSDLTNMIAISESTPGPIGVNMATYVGRTVEGVAGGILATLSLVLPSFLVILIVARVLDKFNESKLVKDIFYGLRPAALGMICAAVITIFETTFFMAFDIKKVILFLLLTFGVFKFKKHPIVYILIGAAFGMIFSF